MTPSINYQKLTFLDWIMNKITGRSSNEEKSIQPLPLKSGDDTYNLSYSDSERNGEQEVLIEIGPRLDIQASIDLLTCYKKIPQDIKIIKIDLKDAQVAHGAVLQTLIVIEKSCVASGKKFLLSGLSADLRDFFQLARLDDLLVGN